MRNKFRVLLVRSLHMPFLYKFLLANSVMTALLAAVAAFVAVWHVEALPTDAHYDLIPIFIVGGLAISLTVNYLVLRVILAPVERLETAVDDARNGKGPIPNTISLVSDARFDRLVAEIGEMQASLDKNAQQVRRLSQSVIYAQEEERKRIARELHDEAAQTLTSVLLYLKLLEKSSKSEDAQRLQNLRKLTAHALSEIRRLALELHPKILDEWGLEAALGQRVDEINTNGSMQVNFQIEGHIHGRLPRDLELTFYRVAQEALSNIVQHSYARCAQVTLRRDATWLTLEVEDDGIGFDCGLLPARQLPGFGLAGIRERLTLVSGEFTIESRPGSGTRLCARAPFVPAVASAAA